MTYAWVLRPYEPTRDAALVFATWINSYRDESTFGRHMRPHTFSVGHHAAIEKVLARHGVRAVMACDSQDPDQLFGYAVYEPRPTRIILHYIFVKRAPVNYRRCGLGRALVNLTMTQPEPDGTVLTPVVCSHMSIAADVILFSARQRETRQRYRFAYSPYLIFDPDVEVEL